MRRHKLCGVMLCLILLLTFTAPSFAQNKEKRGFPITKSDLRNLNPRYHPYFWSVIGGAAIGAAAGQLLGSGNDVTKGLLVGAGGASAAYLHSHPRTGGRYRAAEYLFSHAALGTGIGWTLCGCADGAWGGGLIGFGVSALWQASKAPGSPRRVATQPAPTGTRGTTAGMAGAGTTGGATGASTGQQQGTQGQPGQQQPGAIGANPNAPPQR